MHRRVRPLAVVAAAALASLVVAGAAGAAAWPRTARLADGSTVVVSASGHVVHRDAKGQLAEESWCGSGAAYLRRVALLSDFRSAVLKGNAKAAAAFVAFPLAWNHDGRHETVADAAALARAWPRIFTTAVVDSLRPADPRALFCRNGSQFTAGGGAVWGEEAGGRPRIFAVSSF